VILVAGRWQVWPSRRVSLGRAPKHEDLHRSTRAACEARLPEPSIFRLLSRESHRLFPDEAFADLFSDIGRCCVPPRIVSVVMVLQRVHGLSDREAADAFAFDLRWKYAAGALDFDHPGFVHTVLVDMRERLRRSARPDRIFEVVLDVAKEAGLVGRKRVLDSTALYDAVATQDTVTLMRSAIRGLLREADDELEGQLRSILKRDDDYTSAGKPGCDWDDKAAREALVDELARDGYAALWTIDDRKLVGPLRQAAELLATVLGQDLEQRDDGVFRIARRVASDRLISTVDPEARHGHKTAARGFDGYKGHISVDPDSEIIVATTVTAGNAADGSVAKQLLEESLGEPTSTEPNAAPLDKLQVYGDASYGTAEIVEHIEEAGGEANVKVQPPSSAEGTFSKDAFDVDLKASSVRCPAGVLVQIRRSKDGGGIAEFAANCQDCALRGQCTASKGGRSIRIHPKEQTLIRSRQRQKSPAWKANYRAIRPKVERKLAHLVRHRHGGRRARVRGRVRIAHDFALLAAGINLKRIATLRAPRLHTPPEAS
jgi:Transposase DDE domain/Transposase domain (DUF772)